MSAKKSNGGRDGSVSASVRCTTTSGQLAKFIAANAAAINLPSVAHSEIGRGQELARIGYLLPTRVLTVHLKALANLRRPLKHRTEVRLHLGTADIMATVSLLDCDAIESSGVAFAQLFLAEPVTAVWGQPFVLRDSSAEHTLGGGRVLQPVAKKIRRRHMEMLRWIEPLAATDEALRADAAAWLSGWAGVTTLDLIRGAGIDPQRALEVIEKLQAEGKLIEVATTAGRVLLHAERFEELQGRLMEAVGKLHSENPLMTSLDRQKVLATLDYIGDNAVLHGVIDWLLRQRKLAGDAKRIARADFNPKLSVNQRKLKDKIVAAHREAGFQPPEPSTFAVHAGGNAAALDDIFEVAVAEGLLVRISPSIYLHADVATEMFARLAKGLAEKPAGMTVAEIRDLFGTTRKYAIPLCEFLDRTNVTRRVGDLRVSFTNQASVAS